MSNSSEHVPNQILAIVKNGINEVEVKKAIVNAGGTPVKITSNGRLTAVLIEADDVESTMRNMEQSSCFESIQLNHTSRHQ